MADTHSASDQQPTNVRTPDSTLNADSIPQDSTHVIIAGSRSATDVLSDDGLQLLITDALDTANISPDAVISGTASGVDTAGEAWAHANGNRPIARFSAPWDEHGRSAGPIRNRWMAEYAAHHGDPGILLAIIDYPSSGTESMIELARDILGDTNVYVVPITPITDDDARAELEPVLHRP